MLIAKDLPKYLWAEAINYATWLKNRLPSRATPGTTPFELVQKAKPSLVHVHKFGVKVYVHLQDAGKLEPKAEEAIFVGVDTESKAYRVYWPGKCRVSVERNLTFVPREVTVAKDTLNEGESNVIMRYDEYNSSNGNNKPDKHNRGNGNNVPIVQPIPPPATPARVPQRPITPPAPRTTRTRPPPGYYVALNEGETVSIALDSLLEASK